MNAANPSPRLLLLWPGVAIVVLQWLTRFVMPAVFPETLMYAILGGAAAGLLVLLWWLFLSRAPWLDRLMGVALLVLATFLAPRILDKSIAGGMMGMMFAIYSIPVTSLLFVLWAVLTRNLSLEVRRATMVATILAACGGWMLLRTNGISGSGSSDFAFRWTKTPEEILVAHAPSIPGPLPVVALAAKVAPEPVPVTIAPIPKTKEPVADWPGFRGPSRDSIIPGVRIKTDWSATPPVQMWRKPVGPGWSSFAVAGDLMYTQEQRGEDEVVSCYNATTGTPVWAHRDAARFYESNAGAGPRSTPTLHDGHVYTFGATGILNALDARDGSVLWTRNAATDTSTKTPGWGFSSSPLIVDNMVIVAASGQLAAYDLSTGAPRWVGPTGGDSYSSPQLATVDGIQQVLLNSAQGLTSVSPADGKLLWTHAWTSGTRIMQPIVAPGGDLLITNGDAMGGIGMRRIGLALGPSGWTSSEQWTSPGLKPSFNDSVLHNGNVYGFDGAILACINAKDGKRLWKGGRYGCGQLVLLRDQDVLLVLSEEGDIALVKATPDKFTELAKIPAIEGKTWNHPVLTVDRLLVRNGAEMAAFRLALEPR